MWPLIISFLTLFYRKCDAQHLAVPYLRRYLHYCLLSCFDGEILIPNIACNAAPCLPSYLCGEGHKRLPFNDTEREYIVRRHNEIRNTINATDMLVMSYDRELEFLAACWANQCAGSPRPSHGRDKCRATNTFTENGQSLWANASQNWTVDWSDISHVEIALMSWYNQRYNVLEDVIRSYRYSVQENYEYYTQMVWAETYIIGCGRTQFSVDDFLGVFIVCNYGPAGNRRNEPVYMSGYPPCSSIFAFLPATVLFWRSVINLTSETPANQCDVPVLNPFDNAVMVHTRQIKIKCKNPIVHLVNHDLEYLTVADEPFLSMNQLNCCYTPYLQIGSGVERRFGNTCEAINKKTKAKYEFVRVQCNYGEHTVYADYIDFVLSKKKFPPVKKQSNHLNVLIFLLDGVSRMAAYRHLPRTRKYLEKLNAIEFTKFMRIGENSFPNVMALLTGYHPLQYYLCWRPTMDDTFDMCPFIWKTFSEEKFLTAYAEDGGFVDTFNHEKKGFYMQPVDYYWRPFNLLLDEIKTQAQNAETPFTKTCAGEIPLHIRFLNYTRKFVKRMTKDRQKFFGFFHSNSASHDDNSLLASIDEDLEAFFMELKDIGALKQTAIFFLSDHGTRYGEIRQTYQGFFEANLPLLFVYLPEHFKNKYVPLYNAFKTNKDKLTTMYDIHATLQDIASIGTKRKHGGMSGISLFQKIPTKRSCTDAKIPSNFCACAQNYVMVTDHTLILIAGQTVVNYINEMLDSIPDCAILSVNKVLDARYVKFWSEFKYLYQLKVIVTTQPGTGVFEGVLREIKDKYVVVGSISRLSMYGKESSCIKNTTLKLYCYCH
ncbi:hypothetical protein Trydic_g427 [Trypoxylus dichotomus]